MLGTNIHQLLLKAWKQRSCIETIGESESKIWEQLKDQESSSNCGQWVV